MTSEFSLNSQESIMPTKDASDFRFHRLERDQQYTDLQVTCMHDSLSSLK